MISALFGVIIHICMNLFFVYYLKQGVTGTGHATTVSQLSVLTTNILFTKYWCHDLKDISDVPLTSKENFQNLYQ